MQPDAGRRRRLTASITLLGVMLSVAAFHVSVLTRFQYFEEVTRIQGWGALFFSIAATISALIVVPLAVYHTRDLAQNPGHPITWFALGAGFGILTPLFTGGFTRAVGAFTGLAEGHLGIGDFFSLMLDAVLVFPYDFAVEGTINLIVGSRIWCVFRCDRLRHRSVECVKERKRLHVGTLGFLGSSRITSVALLAAGAS